MPWCTLPMYFFFIWFQIPGRVVGHCRPRRSRGSQSFVQVHCGVASASGGTRWANQPAADQDWNQGLQCFSLSLTLFFYVLFLLLLIFLSFYFFCCCHFTVLLLLPHCFVCNVSMGYVASSWINCVFNLFLPLLAPFNLFLPLLAPGGARCWQALVKTNQGDRRHSQFLGQSLEHFQVARLNDSIEFCRIFICYFDVKYILNSYSFQAKSILMSSY